MSLFSTRFSRWLRQAILRQATLRQAILGLLILCCCVLAPAWGQNQQPQDRLPLPCGTPDLTTEQTKAFAKYIKQAEADGQQLNKAATGITYFGIKPWIVTNSAFWTSDLVRQSINKLNVDFIKAKVQFYIVSGGMGQITATSSRTLTYPADEANLVGQNFDATAINVYFGDVVLSCNNSSCRELGGISPSLLNLTTAGDRPSNIPSPNVRAKKDNYILMSQNSFLNTLSHEMGHYFGLLHTFQGADAPTCDDRERPIGTRPFGDNDRGDLIADTDADPYPLYSYPPFNFNVVNCTYTGILLHCNTAWPESQFSPPVNNVMSYWGSADICVYNHVFSPLQASRMQTFISPRLDPANQYHPQNGIEGVTVGPAVSLSVTETSRLISVSALPGALGYILETDNSPDFPNPVIVGTASETATLSFYNTDVPPPGTTFYYRVRANNSKTYSRILSFSCVEPTATLTGSQTITGGQSATYTVALTGAPPWRVQFEGLTYDNVTTSPLRIVSQPFQALAGTYTQTTSGGSVTNSCGTVPISGTASVMVSGTASGTVSGTCTPITVDLSNLEDARCGSAYGLVTILTSNRVSGNSHQLINTTTGTSYSAIYNIAIDLVWEHYFIGMLLSNQITERLYYYGTGILPPGPYSLTVTDTTTGCRSSPKLFTIRGYGPDEGGATATLVSTNNNRINRGQQTSIRVQLTGTAPWSVTYTGRAGREFVVSDINTSFYDIMVAPDSTTTYRLVAVSGQCSPKAVSGSVTLIVMQPLTQLEYFVDADPGVGRAASVAVESNQTTTSQSVAVPVSVSGGAGVHLLGVRAKDANGYWSSTTLHPFVVLGTGSASTTAITAAEYYVDTDPGVGRAVALPGIPTPGVPYSLSINTTGLAPGTHTIAVRTKDGRNRWSFDYVRSFVTILDARGISRIEYFFDNNDPGVSLGQPFIVDFPNSKTVNGVALAGTSSLSVGTHTVKVRAEGRGLVWSATNAASFTVTPCAGASATLAGSFTTTTDQPLSVSVSLGGSAPFSLTANGQVQTNILTNTATIILPPTPPGTYTLTPQSLSLAVANGCGPGSASGQIRVTVPQGSGCTVMQTVKAGLWDDPAVWSCGRVPVLTDAVQIQHAVTVRGGFVAHAQKIGFAEGGTLSWGVSARLLLGL